MANDFRSARFWAQELIEKALFDGARAVDATMGNGHDTCFLAELARTRQRLTDARLMSRAELFCMGHERMAEAVDGEVDAIVFNLGWLPGAEHGVTTRVETTLAAVNAALELLKEDGLLTICVYPGHAEGARERKALIDWAKSLDEKCFDAMLKTYLNQTNDPPLLIAVKKKKTRRKGEGK